MNKVIRWNSAKAETLRADKTRGGISFEDCVIALDKGNLIEIIRNPSANHAGQRMFVLNIEGYAYVVPFAETEDEIFLKTVIPSRKYTSLYLGRTKK